MKEIANGARIMEMVGLSLSLLSVACSIFIFSYFRTLRCHRTRIHRNLFVAILIHIAIQLTVHTDQFVARLSGDDVGGTAVSSLGTIHNTSLLCEVLLTFVEYSKTVMFMWMFIEGVYLHNMVVVSVFSGKPNYILYYAIGWGIPVIITTTWAITNGLMVDTQSQCWFGYTYRPYYWILEGPRVAIIGVNLIFLLNIIRVLVTKLRKTSSTEALQVSKQHLFCSTLHCKQAVTLLKAVKAAIVLLPLLGFNNFLALVEAPLDTPVKFAAWSYTSHFLISFQGFFISLLYCFLNGEVQTTISQYWARHRQSRDGFSASRRTQSRTLSMTISEIHLHQRRDNETTSFMNDHKKASLYDAGVTTSLRPPEADG
ncbi:PDF receptor [Lamellibrachia satsuma]|nr:PDF receptor [Lamellibrachia satsuma]